MIQALDPQLANAPVFTAFRNDELLGNFRGNKGHDNLGDFIDFKYPNKIAVGDIITDVAGNEYVVSGIDKPRNIGGVSFNRYFKVYYSAKKASPPTMNVVNINNPTNSPVYIQQSNAPSTMLANFQEQINQCDEADKAILQELYAIVLEIYNGNKTVKKSGLAKFGDVIVKYGPIATALGQLLCQIFIH